MCNDGFDWLRHPRESPSSSLRNVYNMAAGGRVKNWRDFLDRNNVIPVAWDRQSSSPDESSPFCLSIKTVEGLIPKVNHSSNPQNKNIFSHILIFQKNPLTLPQVSQVCLPCSPSPYPCMFSKPSHVGLFHDESYFLSVLQLQVQQSLLPSLIF